MPDKVLTIKEVTVADFRRIVVHGDGTMAGDYQLKDSKGATVGNHKTITATLTADQMTKFLAFLRDDIGIAAKANTQEGM